jgi:hypothetical protein
LWCGICAAVLAWWASRRKRRVNPATITITRPDSERAGRTQWGRCAEQQEQITDSKHYSVCSIKPVSGISCQQSPGTQ